MAMHTQHSLSGFIASTPHLSFTDRGDVRFYAKIGQEHYQRNDDGSFTKLETTFHDLVQYRRAAERSYAAFAKGDKFVAEGYIHPYEYTNAEGQDVQGEEFVAKKIGHDTARTTYTVNRDRTRPNRNAAPEQGTDSADREGTPAQVAEPARSSTPSAAVSL
jgi:single-strand DNA-binding protein